MPAMKKHFKRFAVVLAIFICFSFAFNIVRGLFFNKPDTYVPMDDKLKTGQNIFSFVLTHGLPDKIDVGSYSINQRISLDYYDEEIIGKAMDCSYEFVLYWLVPAGGLCSVCFSQEGEEYNKERFYDDANTYLQANFPKDEYVIDWEGEGMYESADLYTTYSFGEGAIGQNTDVVACDNYGYIRFDWIW